MAKKSLSREAKRQGYSLTNKTPKPTRPAPAVVVPPPPPPVVVPPPPPPPAPAVVVPPPPPKPAPKPPEPKVKRPRYVRPAKPEGEAAEKAPVTAPIPPRSQKFFGKLMSKGLALPPKDDGPVMPGR